MQTLRAAGSLIFRIEDCAGGMYLDSGRLYRSSLRGYPRSGWYAKIRMSYELYGLFGMTTRHTNRISTLGAGAYVSDCNSADAAHA